MGDIDTPTEPPTAAPQQPPPQDATVGVYSPLDPRALDATGLPAPMSEDITPDHPLHLDNGGYRG